MPRREHDDRPSIEVFGGAPDVASSREVELGGTTRSSRLWWLPIGAAAAIIAASMVLVGGDDDERAASTTSTTTGRTTSTSVTTSTVPAPLGPLLPIPTGGSLVLARDNGPWQVVDLDSGTHRMLDPFAVSLPVDLYGGVASVAGGLVIVGSGRAYYQPLLGAGEAVALGDAGSVVGSGDPTRVWLVRSDATGVPTGARLVDLHGRVLAEVDPPPGFIYQGTVDGLLTSGGGRVYVLGPDGHRLLAFGELSTASGSTVVVHACDERARCGPELVDIRDGRRRAVDALWGPLQEQGRQYFLMPDGSVLETSYQATGLRLRWADPSGRVIGTMSGAIRNDPIVSDVLSFAGEPVTLPAGLGILWMQSDHRVVRIYPDGRGGIEVAQIALPPDARVDRVLLVIP